MSDKKIDVAALRSAFDSLAKAVSVVADAMKEFAACLDDPAIMAALQAAVNATPWRYFRDLTGGVVRVRDESGGCYYYASEPSRKSTLPLSFWVRASLEAPAKLGEITEDEAAKIVGGRPWEQSVRYFYAFHSPSRGIVRFVGEEGTIYRINGCSTKTVLSLSWHEQSGVEVEISEEQAVAILGGNRPWNHPADV